MAYGQCPKCGEVPHHVVIESVKMQYAPAINAPAGPFYGLSYSCPNPKCKSILSVGPDFDDFAAELAKKIRS
jgi:hypothetical protein